MENKEPEFLIDERYDSDYGSSLVPIEDNYHRTDKLRVDRPRRRVPKREMRKRRE